MDDGLLDGLVSGALRTSRAVLTRRQALSAARQARALANVGIGRASLSAVVTRTNSDTLTNTGLSALDVPVEAGSRYRIEYSIYITVAGSGGFQSGVNYPTMTDISMVGGGYYTNNDGGTVEQPALLSWPNLAFAYASGTAIISSAITPAGIDLCAVKLSLDLTPSASGTVKLLAGQVSSTANAMTIGQNTCVSWEKF